MVGGGEVGGGEVGGGEVGGGEVGGGEVGGGVWAGAGTASAVAYARAKETTTIVIQDVRTLDRFTALSPAPSGERMTSPVVSGSGENVRRCRPDYRGGVRSSKDHGDP